MVNNLKQLRKRHYTSIMQLIKLGAFNPAAPKLTKNMKKKYASVVLESKDNT